MTERPVALVTGAGRGLGRALAEKLGSCGYTVVGCGRSAYDAAFEYHAVDVGDEAGVRELIGAIDRRHGRLDLLVNNAGIGLSALAVMTPTLAIEELVRTNLIGPMLVTRESARIMIRQRAGRVVNIASVAVPLQMDGASLYSATKAGLIQYTHVLAKELASFGITCNVVAPSLVDTEMKRALSAKAVEAYLTGLTIKRLATVDDVANAVLFFASTASGYVTGQVLYLGLSA